MKTLTITIIGISAISILIDVLLPDGKTSKYIKGIYSLLTIVIIISNVVNIYKGGINYEQFFGEPSVNIEQNDEAAIKIINDKYKNRCKSAIKALAERGIVGADITTSLTEKKPYDLSEVFVYVSADYKNRDEEIKNAVSVILVCRKERITVYVR